VVLEVDKVRQKAEAKLNVNGGEIFATSEEEVMYAAIDSLVDKLDRQVIKHKEKMIRH
jgi:putative sigma-54 modulation protein